MKINKWLIAIALLIVVAGLYFFISTKNVSRVKQSVANDDNSTIVLPTPTSDPIDRFQSIPFDTLNKDASFLGQYSSCSEPNARALLVEINKAGSTVTELFNNNTVNGYIGFAAMGTLEMNCSDRSEIMSYFSSILNSPESSQISIVVAGDIIASVGQPQATQVIVDWAKMYKGDASDAIYKWLFKIRDEGSVKILTDATGVQSTFLNSKNKDAMIKVAKDWCGARSKNLQPEGCKNLVF